MRGCRLTQAPSIIWTFLFWFLHFYFILLGSSGWPPTCDPPAWASWVVGFHVYASIGSSLLKWVYRTKQVQVFLAFLLIPNMENLRYTISTEVEDIYVNNQSNWQGYIPNLANNDDIIEQYYELGSWAFSLSFNGAIPYHIDAICPPDPLWLSDKRQSEQPRVCTQAGGVFRWAQALLEERVDHCKELLDLVRLKQANAGETISLALPHRTHSLPMRTVTLYQNLESQKSTQTNVQMFWLQCQRSRCLTNSQRVNCICWCSPAELVRHDHRLWLRANGGQCSSHPWTGLLCQSGKLQRCRDFPFCACLKHYWESKSNRVCLGCLNSL